MTNDTTENKDIFQQQIEHIKVALNMAKQINLQRNGREDCKNCSLLEVIEEIVTNKE